jgi:hypothetical protein
MQERALCSSNTPVKGNLSRESPKQSEWRDREREREKPQKPEYSVRGGFEEFVYAPFSQVTICSSNT